MNWDVVFLLRGFPPQYRFVDRHYFMADVAEPLIEELLKATTEMSRMTAFFTAPKTDKCTAVGFRVEADNEEDAVERAKDHLAGFIDGLAILLDRNLPRICPLIQVRKTGEAEVRLIEVGDPTWAYFNPKDPSSEEMWQERSEKVFRELFPFFDIASGLHPRSNTSLSRQMLYSMKMYRHGAATGVYGLEFICKWSALEGLVCGGTRKWIVGGKSIGKGKMLEERISALFPLERDAVKAKVKRLWDLRSDAVHEARAFHSDFLHEAHPLGLEIEEVESLFLVVVIFALSHLDRADCVEALWPFAAAFQSPSFALQQRPADMPRVLLTKVKSTTGLILKEGGAIIDAAFAAHAPPPSA